MILLKQMLLFFFVMMLGYGMARKGILEDKVSKSISWLVVNVANPALILSGSLAQTSIGIVQILSAMALAFLVFFVLIVIAEVVLPHLGYTKEELGIYKVMLVFSNMGFMGFPIVAAIYGNGALLYASAFLIPFNLLIYTYGVICIGSGNLKDNWIKVANIGVLACILSFFINIFQWSVWDMGQNAITMLSNLTAPLSMLVIGASFQHIKVWELVADKKILFFCFLRLLLLPFIGIWIIKGFIEDPILCGVCLVALAAPAGSMSVMLANQYEGDTDTATKGVALTTVLSVITMPLLFEVLGL